MTETNRSVRELARSFELGGLERWTWNFFCECGRPNCRGWVVLGTDEYDSARARRERIVALGHGLADALAA